MKKKVQFSFGLPIFFIQPESLNPREVLQKFIEQYNSPDYKKKASIFSLIPKKKLNSNINLNSILNTDVCSASPIHQIALQKKTTVQGEEDSKEEKKDYEENWSPSFSFIRDKNQ